MHVGLNLLFIIPGENGGTQVYAESLMWALAAQGADHTYTVFVSEEGAALPLPPGFRQVVCPVRAVRRDARYAYEQLRFPRLLRGYSLDVLHSLGYVCPLRSPCPSIVTIHDLNYLTPWHGMSRAKRLSLGWFVRQSARRADAVVTVSEFSKQEIKKHLGVPEQKITVTAEGPRDGPALRPSSGKAVAEQYGVGLPYLMAFGSASGNKNLGRLVRAFAQVCAEVPHTLLLAGRGHSAALQAEIEALGLVRRVAISGYLPDSDVMPLLAGADLFVFPSLYEGFGLPVLEAQRAGTAVACSSAASLPEVAGDGAEFFCPESVEEMGQVILRCLRDPDRRAALAERGWANVARFSWAQTAAATLACYRAQQKPVPGTRT